MSFACDDSDLPPNRLYPARLPGGGDARCMCGSLLARLTKEGVEIKCRRCRRTVVLPLTPPDGRADSGPSADPS